MTFDISSNFQNSKSIQWFRSGNRKERICRCKLELNMPDRVGWHPGLGVSTSMAISRFWIRKSSVDLFLTKSSWKVPDTVGEFPSLGFSLCPKLDHLSLFVLCPIALFLIVPEPMLCYLGACLSRTPCWVFYFHYNNVW